MPPAKNQRTTENGDRVPGVSPDDVPYLRGALAADGVLYRSQLLQGGPEQPAADNSSGPNLPQKPRWDDGCDAMEVDEDEDSFVGSVFQTNEEVSGIFVLYYSCCQFDVCDISI